MKLRNPFSNRKVMSQESDKQSEFQDNPIAEEIQRSSEAEASEQKPLEEDPIGKLEKEISELKDNHLRLYAEFENYKRRNIKERAELIKSAGSDIISSLLPTLDDFERALKAMGENADPSTREGIVLIHQKLLNTLEQKGLKPMDSIGHEFDVELHEAITKIPVEDAAMKGKIVDEVEKGYWLNEKVIRYAKVVVGS
ncbi:MAG: nucleotide exchange factor GrpE [Bacteroidetes bacterium]|nr:nucleotide exchange factor GrpE [Bacteroidota bacterium]